MSVCYIDCSPFMRALLTPDAAARVPGLQVHDEPSSQAEVVERLRDAIVAVNGHTPMSGELMRRCPRLRSIVFLGSGASSYIDVDAAATLGIEVRSMRSR
jgi:D-3-phosphoglycerate dehydrogenase